jgi:hypothetical protein
MADTLPYGSTPALLDKDPVFATIAERPPADYYGGRPWKCQVDNTMYTSNGIAWRALNSGLITIETKGESPIDTVINDIRLAPFVVSETITLNRVSGYIGTTQASKLIEIAIFDNTMNMLVTTEQREVPIAGPFEFSHVPTTLDPGTYYYAVSCNGTTATMTFVQGYGGFFRTSIMPMNTLITSITPTSSHPKLVGHAVNLDTPYNFAPVDFTGISVVGAALSGYTSSKAYGLRASNSKITVSTDGDTWTDLMTAPALSVYVISDLLEYNNQLYLLRSDTSIYRSSDLTSSATWTDITCPIQTGLKRSLATTRPYGIALFQDYLVWGEYSAAADLTTDPADPAPPRIFKYGPLSGTPTWTLSKQMTGARHIHSFFSDQTVKLWASVGDNGYGADVGLWRCTAIATDTWARWTNNATPYAYNYPVDIIELNPAKGAPTGVYGCGDKRGKHLMMSQVSGNPNGFNMNTQLWGHPETGETVRSLVYNPLDTNLYYFVTEAPAPAPGLYVTPAPYTQAYKLLETADITYLGRSVVTPKYIFMRARKWLLAKFPWQKPA